MDGSRTDQGQPVDEATTRKTLIDAALRLAGWQLDHPTQVVEEYVIDLVKAGVEAPIVAEPGFGNRHGKQYADYALLSRGRVIAVVEAKKTARAAELGQEQALTYARNIRLLQGGRPPFVLYTNGHDIYLWEVDDFPPIKVRGFPSPLDLEWMDQRRQTRNPLSVELIDTVVAGRDYQIGAIRSVLEGVEAKRRNFLLVMATGTGKTRTAMGLIDVLLRAHWAKRVLFLVDRLALRDQAIDAFREYLPDSPHWPRIEGTRVELSWDPNRRLYCTTYPTMLNLILAGTVPESWISPHFFDLVIADESHRSIYNIYRSVLDWFTGIKLGLTATPRDHIDHDTLALFDCDTYDPTYAYTFEQATSHEPPYLSDFEVLRVRSSSSSRASRAGSCRPRSRSSSSPRARTLPRSTSRAPTWSARSPTPAPTRSSSASSWRRASRTRRARCPASPSSSPSRWATPTGSPPCSTSSTQNTPASWRGCSCPRTASSTARAAC